MDAVTVVEESFSGPVVQALLAERTHAIVTELGRVPSGGSAVAACDFIPPGGAFFVAVIEGLPAGCAGLRRLDHHTGEVKRLFVRKHARRQGAARALLIAIEDRAASLGLRTLRLDTNSDHALALFQSVGYKPIPDYNGNEYARHWMEKRIRS